MVISTSELSNTVTEQIRGFMGSLAPSSLALAFSGGIDSSFLLSFAHEDTVPYVVGIKGSPDIARARESAALLGRKLHEIVLLPKDVISYARKVVEIDPGIDFRDLGFETVLAAALDHIGCSGLITGQGADEIFYGYARFLSNPDQDNSHALKKLFSKTLPREKKIASHFEKRLICPYLESGIWEIPGINRRDLNINGSMNKAILREAALSSGISPDIALRPKKAAQYGSGVMKILKREIGSLYP